MLLNQIPLGLTSVLHTLELTCVRSFLADLCGSQYLVYERPEDMRGASCRGLTAAWDCHALSCCIHRYERPVSTVSNLAVACLYPHHGVYLRAVAYIVSNSDYCYAERTMSLSPTGTFNGQSSIAAGLAMVRLMASSTYLCRRRWPREVSFLPRHLVFVSHARRVSRM
jgi:hypothetical protein